MKILYLSCFHGTFEYDNCITFQELGIDWFSTGIYHNPRSPLSGHSIATRPEIDKEPSLELIEQFLLTNKNYFSGFTGLNRPDVRVSKEFVDKFDVVFTTSPRMLVNNWDCIKHKPIVWRTSGAINEKIEDELRPYVEKGNVFPVRFSKQELLSPRSNGGSVIRNFVDEDLYNGWSFGSNVVLSFQSWFTQRRSLNINKNYLKHVYPNFCCHLYGAYTDRDPISRGCLSWEEQTKAYKECGVYFYIGSPVGVVAYNFMEAMMSGCPVVTYGPKLGGWTLPSTGQLLHEPSEFIDHGGGGFWANNVEDIKKGISNLLQDENYAKEVSQNARSTALEFFSKKKSVAKWREFFSNLK